MSISPVANIRASQAAVGTEPHTNPPRPTKNSNRQQPADSVHLSPAAQKQLQRDADGDGDSK